MIARTLSWLLEFTVLTPIQAAADGRQLATRPLDTPFADMLANPAAKPLQGALLRR